MKEVVNVSATVSYYVMHMLIFDMNDKTVLWY